MYQVQVRKDKAFKTIREYRTFGAAFMRHDIENRDKLVKAVRVIGPSGHVVVSTNRKVTV